MTRKKKSHVITVEEVVYTLLRHAAENDTWTLDYDKDQSEFIEGYGLRVDQDTCQITCVEIEPKEKEYCEQCFSFELLDGLVFSTTVMPGEKPVWKPSVDLPFLYYKKDKAMQKLLLDEMNRLLGECVELKMFDPLEAWCPEGLEDCPIYDIEELMDSDARYFAKWDANPDGIDESCPDYICICRNDADMEKIMKGTDSKSLRKRTYVHEVTFDEAAKYLRECGIADDINWAGWPDEEE